MFTAGLVAMVERSVNRINLIILVLHIQKACLGYLKNRSQHLVLELSLNVNIFLAQVKLNERNEEAEEESVPLPCWRIYRLNHPKFSQPTNITMLFCSPCLTMALE